MCSNSPASKKDSKRNYNALIRIALDRAICHDLKLERLRGVTPKTPILDWVEVRIDYERTFTDGFLGLRYSTEEKKFIETDVGTDALYKIGDYLERNGYLSKPEIDLFKVYTEYFDEVTKSPSHGNPNASLSSLGHTDRMLTSDSASQGSETSARSSSALQTEDRFPPRKRLAAFVAVCVAVVVFALVVFFRVSNPVVEDRPVGLSNVQESTAIRLLDQNIELTVRHGDAVSRARNPRELPQTDFRVTEVRIGSRRELERKPIVDRRLVELIASLGTVEKIDFSYIDVQPHVYQIIAEMTSIKQLLLAGVDLSNPDFRWFSNATHLQLLDIRETIG